MKKQFSYGHTVDVCPVILAKGVQIFIPKLFPWERGAEKAEIILDSKHRVNANVGSKILRNKGGKHIKEIEIPFELGESNEARVILTDILEKEGIDYERGEGIYCDGYPWTQKDSTSEITYCEDGSLKRCGGPYWGEQYQFDFRNKWLRPVVGGKKMRCLRFSECKDGVWPEMESLFRRIMERQTCIEYHELSLISRKVSKAGAWNLSVFVKKENGYEWEYLEQ